MESSSREDDIQKILEQYFYINNQQPQVIGVDIAQMVKRRFSEIDLQDNFEWMNAESEQSKVDIFKGLFVHVFNSLAVNIDAQNKD